MSVPHSVPITVVAATGPGREVDRFVLAHGADPVRELARHGWAVLRVQAADVVGGAMELVYAVAAATPRTADERAVPTDPGLVVGEGERPEPYQRTAAYGVVTSVRGVLLTELSARTASPGRWTLPGGGLDPGESPLAALHREVWEESGQRVEAPELLEVTTSHWVGRAPSGRLEDFHAVRVVYAAWCPEPTDPVVHDVGGSTESVRWVARDEVQRWPLTGFATHLQRWLRPG